MRRSMVHARRGLSATHPTGSDFFICNPGYRSMLPTGHNYSSANSKNSVDRELQQFLLKAKNRLERIARSTGSGARATDLYGEVWIAVCTLRERLNRELDLFQSEDEDRIFSFVYSRLRRQTDWKLHFADRLDFDDGEGLRLSERLADSRPDEACAQTENYNALACTYSQAFAYIVALSNFRNELALLANHLAITLPALRARMRNLNKQARTQPSLFDRKQRMDENFVPLPGRQIRSLLKTPVMDGEHATLF